MGFSKEDYDIGIRVARLLHLEPDSNGIYSTRWGNKTANGLGASIKRVVEEVKREQEMEMKVK